METRQRSITRMPNGSGYKAFHAAVEKGYHGNSHNPCVRWSPSRGFVAVSSLLPPNDDEMTVGICGYDACSGGRNFDSTQTEYRSQRARILAFYSDRMN